MGRFGRQEQFWMIAGDIELCVDQMHPIARALERRALSWIGQTNTLNRRQTGSRSRSTAKDRFANLISGRA
jgi:hypothetical protein